jgi:putative OPT family oligopeptide transporter
MAGLVGSSNNPVSGITIATILFAALVLLAFLGKDSAIGPVAAVMIGAVVCCAACVAGDNLQDLKAGYLVGATPWRQQVMLAIGSVCCALVMAPVLNMLAQSYGIGPRTLEHPRSLEAAQANLMASVAKGLFGGHLPWTMIMIGAGIGVAVIILDQVLKARGAKFRVPVLAAAIGIYLPLETMVPIFLGGLLNYLVTRTFGTGMLLAPTKSARISVRLLVVEVLVATTLGLADTEAELEGELNSKGSAGAMLPGPDCTRTVSGFETPPAVPTMSIDPALAGAVYT